MVCFAKGCRYNTCHVTLGHQCGNCKEFGHGRYECGNQPLIDELYELYKNDRLSYNNRCTISNCRYSWSHTRASHHCRKCNKNHGYSDCPQNPKNVKEGKKEIEFKIKCPICRVENNIFEGYKKVFGLQDKCKVCFDNCIDIFLPDCGHACLCLECLDKMNELVIDIDILEEQDINEGIVKLAHKILKNITEKSYCIIYAGQGCSYYIRRKDSVSPVHGFFMHGDAWGQYGPNGDDRPKLKYFTRGYKLVK